MTEGGHRGTLLTRVSSLALGAAVACGTAAAQSADGLAKSGGITTDQKPQRAITMAVPLAWRNQILSDVVVQVHPDGSIAMESRSLTAALTSLLTEEGVRRLEETIAGDPFVTSGEMLAGGFDLEFSMSRLELVVNSIDPRLRPVQPLRGRQEERAPLEPSMKPAAFSAYLNTNVNLIHRDDEGTLPPDVFLFGTVRYKNVVFEYDGGFTQEFGEDYSHYRRYARAVYDEPEKYRRWSAGDLQLDSPGLVQTPFLGGIAVEKSRRAFDPVSSSVNLGNRQIYVASPSTVEVLINGSPYQTLDLQPGTYSLEDLPIQTGFNDVQLVIRDSAGREDVTRFDYFYDPIDLNAGDEEYTVAVGLIADELSPQPDYSGDPAVVGHYRKALSDTLVVGGGAQISEDVQVLSAETKFVPQVIPGSFSFQGAVSTGSGSGVAMSGGYSLSTGAGFYSKRLSASATYQSEDFRSVGELTEFSSENLTINASYGQSLSENTSVVAGANYFSRSNAKAQSTYYVDVSHRLTDTARATAGVEYGTGSPFGSNFGVRVGVSFVLGDRHRADASYQSRRELARASVSRGSDNTVGSLGYSVNVQDSKASSSADGIVDYISNRFEARGSLGYSGDDIGGVTDEQTARLQLGTSFAFADGGFGIGRPIQDSFLLARPHKTLDGTDVIAGRSLRGGHEAASGILGAAVVSRLSSYNTQDVQYDIDTLEAGYDIGSGVVRVDPPFRSGYNLLVGTERFVSAVGFLTIDGAPAELSTGLITSDDDEGFEPEPFFTNSAGRFGIIGLAPGRTYTIRLNGSGQTFRIEVPKENKGLYRLETINLQTLSG